MKLKEKPRKSVSEFVNRRPLNGVRLQEKIDVIMCTYNSNKPYFNAVLRRISEEIPVHCFIVVDRFSSDGTVAKILENFPKAKVVLSKENLGLARKMGINIVDTQFFVFIDDDVLLLNGFYDYTKGLMDNRIGAVGCYAHPKGPWLHGLYKHATRPRLVVSSKDNIDSQRGFTYATLVRKETCVTWKPDISLAAGEDHEILRHIVRKGVFWLTSYFVFAEHFAEYLCPGQSYFTFFRDLWKKTVWNTAGCRSIKLTKLNFIELMIKSLVELWSGIKESVLSRNAFVLLYHWVNGLAFFYGYVCWKKGLFLHR